MEPNESYGGGSGVAATVSERELTHQSDPSKPKSDTLNIDSENSKITTVGEKGETIELKLSEMPEDL